jgi:hypothetical protein
LPVLQHELDGVTFAIVVALTDENDDGLEPMEAGPDSVVQLFLTRDLRNYVC